MESISSSWPLARSTYSWPKAGRPGADPPFFCGDSPGNNFLWVISDFFNPDFTLCGICRFPSKPPDRRSIHATPDGSTRLLGRGTPKTRGIAALELFDAIPKTRSQSGVIADLFQNVR